MGVTLAFDVIEGARSTQAVAFLHGILGRGSNLRTIAKRFVEARPEWTAWLVDLRGHGRSPKRNPDPTVAAAAGDVVEMGQRGGPPLDALVGHSFGGKIALEATRLGLPHLRHVMTIDSVPGTRQPVYGGDSALSVIEAIESLPEEFASRAAFVEALRSKGQAREIAQWLSGSTDKDGDRVRFSLDLREVRSLVLNYFERDLWPVLEHPPRDVRIHLVVGERSRAYSAADLERANRLAAETGRVSVDVLPAGHWVHVDDPEGLLETMIRRLS